MATEVPLIPCINRNLSHALDVSESGLVAYGSRGSIYFFNLRTSIPIILDSKFIPNAHRGKVLSLSFCKTSGEFIASIGEDNFIRVWELETGTCVANFEIKEGTRVVEWLHGTAASICFPGNIGFVSKWNYSTNNLAQIKTGSDSFVNVLSSNKMSPELLAVGHKVGSISILNVNTLVLMYKLKSHVMEIASLCWSPVLPSMLLSTSLDQTARMWKLGECKPVKTFSYPRSRKMEDKKYPLKLCGTFHPENPDVIICSNVRGNLGEVTFKEEENPKFDPYEEKTSYYDNSFKTINIMLPYVTEDNKSLLLISDHIKLSLWNISEKKLLSSFSYLNGNVYDLAASTINPYHLAIGAGDGCLRVWNLNETSKVDMTTIVVYTRVKIMAVAWHPTEEGIIAYGSDEGRIGIADLQRKKSLYSFETHHTNSIYAMQWAPCLKIKDSDEDFFLYSCGGGAIYIYELNKPKEKPADFDELITYPPDLEFVQKTHSEISWKSDYTCIIIGSFKGFLDLYDNKFNFLTRVTMQMKIVESVKWHPRYTFTSSKGSDYSSWFAAAGNDENIMIFDTSDIKNGEPESTLCKPAKTLIGHKKKISSLCWSPHNDGYLASASRDGTVLVWNAISSTIIANYSWHKELVYAVHWSYFDPDTIYSGGMDSCLRVWKISEQIKSAPEKCQVIKRKSKLKNTDNNRKGGACRKEKERSVEDDSCDYKNTFDESAVTFKSIQRGLCTLLSSFGIQAKGSAVTFKSIQRGLCTLLSSFGIQAKESSQELEVSKTEEISSAEDSNIKNYKTKFEFRDHTPKQKSLFSGFMIGSKEKKLENVLKLTDLLSQPLDSSDPENMTLISDTVTDEESLHCGFFCDQLTALKMLETKAEIEKKAYNNEKSVYLQLMANNVEPLLISAAENKKLTDFLMAAAITVSREFYNDMCKKYAVQLIEEKSYLKAGMYLMFCGELHSAVKTYLEKGRILEALALAKAQLPADDPFITGAVLKASNFFSQYHEYEYEAECYLSLKEPSEAAKTLYRIADSSSMYVSTYICKRFNLIEEAESYGYLCMEKCLAEAAWQNFYKVVDLIDSLKIYRLLVRIHELIFTQIKILKKDGIIASKLFGVTGNKLQIWESKAFGNYDTSFLPFVYDVLKLENIIPDDKESLQEIQNALDSLIAKRQKYETSDEAHINVAICTSQVIVSSLLNDFDVTQKYILKVFPASYNIAFMPRVVFWLYLPFDIYWCTNEDAFICENKYLESQSSSLLHLQDIYKSLCDKFTSLNTSIVEDFSLNQAFSSNLDEAVKQVLSTLSLKSCKDSLILYFSACYITELRKLAKHGWKFRCYDSIISCDKNTKAVLPEDENLPVLCDKKDTDFNDHENIKEHGVEPEVNCSENTNQNTLPTALLQEKDMSNEIINHLSPQNRDSPRNNCNSPPVEENNLIVSSSLISVEDNVKNIENTGAPHMFNKFGDSLIPHDNDDTAAKNGLSKNTNKIENETLSTNKIENAVSPTKIIENAVSPTKIIENGISLTKENGEVEKDEFLHNIDNKIEENETELTIINDKKEENEKLPIVETMSVCDDDHLQCWSDVSLFYILTKSFTSVNCKDEYALFFYLQKYLHYLDSAIANISRKKSAKSVLTNPKELPDVVKVESVLNQNNFCSDEIEAKKDQENSISHSSKSVDAADSPNENYSNCSYNNDCLLAEKEIKKEVGEIQEKCELTVNNNEKRELIDETSIKTPSQENEDEKIDLTQEQMVLENLHAEHEKAFQLMKLLNSVEFDCPNPFDVVSAINGLCCDIIRKNPCSFVKKKFHEFAHEVNKWNAKFCVKDETVKCDICKEIISF